MAFDPVAPIELATAVHRCGLSPEALAAAGVAPGAVTDLVGNLDVHLLSRMLLMQQLDQTRADAYREVESLRRIVRSGRYTPEQLAALPGAKLALEQAETAVDSFISDAFDAACEELGGSATAALSTIEANAERSLPAPYLVSERTDAEWKSLTDALAIERIARERGEDVDESAATILAAVRAEPAVAAAIVATETTLPAIEAAWNAAVGLE